MKSRTLFPTVILCTIFLILFLSSAWYYIDGPTFHLQNFLFGHLNNERDVGRLFAMMFTDWMDLTYIWLGGKSFFFSRQLYVFGQTSHILFPMIYLWSVLRKRPESEERIFAGIWFYILSVVLTRGCSFLYLVNELHAAHTVSWLAIFTWEFGEKRTHRILAILSVFTYPATMFMNGFLFLKNKHIFYLILCILSVGLHLEYNSRYPGSSFLKNFRMIHHNYTVIFYVTMLPLIFLLRSFFPGQRWVFAAIGVLFYFFSNLFGFWQFYPGRMISLVFFIALQGMYITTGTKFITELREKTLVLSVMAIFLMIFQVYQFELYNASLKSVLNEQRKVLSFEEGKALLGPYSRLLHPLTVRPHTLSLELMESNTIRGYMEKSEGPPLDIIDFWTTDIFRKKAHEKGVTFSFLSSGP